MPFGLLIVGDINTLSGSYVVNCNLIARLQQGGDAIEIFSLPRTELWRRLGDNFRPSFIKRTTEAAIDVWIRDKLVHLALSPVGLHSLQVRQAIRMLWLLLSPRLFNGVVRMDQVTNG